MSFCVQTYEVSALGWRSAIWVDNRFPLMCEVRGKWWPKYIIIIIFENLEVQWSRGSTWNKYIIMSYTMSYLRMLCSIYWNTISFTNVWLHHIIWVQNHVYYKGGLKPKYTIMMSLQRFGSRVNDHNIILCKLVHRYETKVFVKNPKKPVQSKPCE